MSYEGVEVDMLSIGNADSILVTRWKAGVASRILIDGGKAGDSATVLRFLKGRGVKFLDHVVCSHPHEDHVGGLVGVVQSKEIDFGQAWVHLPWNHIDRNTLTTALARSETVAKKVVNIIRASVQSSQDLVNAITARGKTVLEPFAGQQIGFLFVCGPSKEFYELLLKDFTDFEKLKKMEEAIAANERQNLVEMMLEGATVSRKLTEAKETGLGQAPTEPENNSSTILWMKHVDDALLFTADAGVEALNAARQAYKIGDLRWMQIPHHGSRRNVNEELIAYFKPKTAFVSADGTRKHPRRAVVNAFKSVGAVVFSTHYPPPNGGHKWFHLGTVPDRSDYSATNPLYELDEKA
jgi:beta-lactamase superfamily II metal-dependent hydrolase